MRPALGTAGLFRYECRRVIRSWSAWIVMALVLLSGGWGALNTARLHHHQAVDQARMAADEALWYQDINARVARYSQPSSIELPYWQDPTDVAGFSRYFLRRFAAKPHLPLSALAVGQSDLQPFAIPIRLETLFGGDRVYDFESPRALATGPFDLSFVLVFVLPLGLAGAVSTIGAQERDEGVLALVATQTISPRRWWAVRLAALAAVLVPPVPLIVAAVLTAAGAPMANALPELLAAAMLVAAYSLLWMAIAGACLTRGQGALSTLCTVAGIWLLFTLAAPVAGSVALRVAAPSPSPVADVNELRRTTDDVQAMADAVVARRLVEQLGPDVRSVDVTALDYSTRLVPITEEMEARLEAQEQRRQAHTHAADVVARTLWWLSPQLAFHTALADLAGTGTARHRDFLRAVRAFQLELRSFIYPRVLEQVRAPTPRGCGGCPARLTFTEFDRIPTFSMPDQPAAMRVADAWRAAAWLALVATFLLVIAVLLCTRWSIDT